MNKIVSTTIALIAALAALPACAEDDFYAGAALGTKGTMIGSTGSSLPFKLYGGFALNEHLAVEAGYTSFGVFEYSGDREIGLRALTIGVKGSFAIADSWSAFGKVGVARHMIDVKGAGLSVREQNKARPMLGVGVGYKLTANLTADLELVSYGKIKVDNGRLAFRQLQLGANYSF